MARKIRSAIAHGVALEPPGVAPLAKGFLRGRVAATRSSDEIDKALRRVLKRARKAEMAVEVRPTPAEYRAIHEKLLPSAIAYARANGRRLPAFAVLCGCRVFIWVNMAGQVGVAADRNAVPLAMSGAQRV